LRLALHHRKFVRFVGSFVRWFARTNEPNEPRTERTHVSHPFVIHRATDRLLNMQISKTTALHSVLAKAASVMHPMRTYVIIADLRINGELIIQMINRVYGSKLLKIWMKY